MRTTLFAAAAVMAGIIVGFLLGISMANRVPLGAEASIEWHWKRVNDFRDYMRDPNSYSPVPGTKLSSATPPYDPEPSLLALKEAGEIKCAEIILPTVPVNRKINQYWMRHLGEYVDVLEATGLPGSSALQVSGDTPLYLKIWFKKSAVADIQKLINDLEALAREADGDQGEVKPSE